MIPARLHHIWLGPLPVPEWAQGWRDMHPAWEHRVWRRKEIERLPRLPLRSWRYYVERECWNGAANVARLAILHEVGGVYVDIDSKPLRPLDGATFLDSVAFAGYEPNVPDLPGRIANGTIGAVAGAPPIATALRLVAGLDALEEPWETTGGNVLTAAFLLHRRCCDIRVLPPRVFYPRDAHGRLTPGLEDPYSDHFWATTNGLYATSSGA